MEFEWDEFKAETNFKKHGVHFSEAATVWKDENAVEILGLHNYDQERWIKIGMSRQARLLVTVYTEIDFEKIRIISARKATRTESEQYER